MAVYNGTSGNNNVNWTSQPLGAGETGHALYGNGGADTLMGGSRTTIGSPYVGSTIDGGDGDDRLIGQTGNDVLIGGNGNDWMQGGGDQDLLFGGVGTDTLTGGSGNGDLLYGGQGNDRYIINLGADGQDIINDDLNLAQSPGAGGGTDRILIANTVRVDAYVGRDGDDLLVSWISDWVVDGVWNEFVRVEDFFLGGNNAIEQIESSDGWVINASTYGASMVDGSWYSL